MKKKLTALSVSNLRPGRERYEVSDADAKGLVLIVQPSGSKSWAMRFRKPGGRLAKLTLGTFDPHGAPDGAPAMGGPLTLAEARELAAQVNRQRASGKDVIGETKREKAVARLKAAGQGDNFLAVLKVFVREHRVRRSGARPRDWREKARILGLRYADEKSEPELIKGGLAERWADRPVGEITQDDCQDVIDKARSHGIPGAAVKNDGASDNRGRKMCDALGAFFRWAKKNRRAILKVNPMLGIDRPPPPAARERFLSDGEVALLWKACDRVVYPFPQVVRLLLITAQRLNEVAGLRWSELEEDGAVIALPGERTKNHRPHLVPLPPLARSILDEAKKIDGCEFVFSITGRGPVSGWSKIKRQLDAAIAEANGGKPIPAWRYHDLRRTARTGLSKLRVDRDVREAVLNHVKQGVEGTYDRYDYFDEKKGALERWAAHVQDVVSGKAANVASLDKARAKAPSGEAIACA
ncbi:MAG: tyrosine-type recombinase/integrase [Pseudomonadota bacterium]